MQSVSPSTGMHRKKSKHNRDLDTGRHWGLVQGRLLYLGEKKGRGLKVVWVSTARQEEANGRGRTGTSDRNRQMTMLNVSIDTRLNWGYVVGSCSCTG